MYITERNKSQRIFLDFVTLTEHFNGDNKLLD